MPVLGSGQGGVKNSAEGGFVACAVLGTASLLPWAGGSRTQGEDTDEGQRSRSRCEKLEDVQPHVVREEEMQDAQG